MTLPTPNLDDRTFDQLVQEALDLVRRRGTNWTDLSVNDPGVVLIEAFAHLTEMMLFRVNQLPDKAYVAFLELLGVRPQPPIAAQAELLITLDAPYATERTLKAGSKVEAAGASEAGTPSVFETLVAVTIPAGQTQARVSAGHCITHHELLGHSTGQAHQRLALRHRPVLGNDLQGENIIVGVERGPGTLSSGDSTIEFEGKSLIVWKEVERFTLDYLGQQVYCVDRFLGEIAFAPTLRLTDQDGKLADRTEPLAALPRPGAEIHVWYRTVGPGSGRVAADRLTGLNPRQPGLSVTNPLPAIAGRAAESIDNALRRGPMTLHSLSRAITARDFEALAQQASAGVNRALAMADATLWVHGARGTVNVTLIPEIADAVPPVTASDLAAAQHMSILMQVEKALEGKRALGTGCRITWARYKPIHVRLRAELFPGQEQAAVAGRIRKLIDEMLSPLARRPDRTGWPFGRSLLSWDVLRAIGDMPGVAALSNIRFGIDAAPSRQVVTLSRDAYQAGTWFTARDTEIFRSGNDGGSWELSASFPDQKVVMVKAYTVTSGDLQERAGLVCAVTQAGGGSQLWLSRDCGQSFDAISLFQFEVNDIAWIFRDRVPSVLLATKTGLFEILMSTEGAPLQIVVDSNDPQMGINSVAVSVDQQGGVLVAVAAAEEQGVFLSTEGGDTGTFKSVALSGELVRVLMIQHTATQRWLWAGVSAVGNDPGKGCFRALLRPTGVDADGWQAFGNGWNAGGCRALAHDGERIYAGSLRRGVLVLEPGSSITTWRTPDVGCGLPLRDVGRLEPVNALAAGPGVVMAGGPKGVFRSDDRGASFVNCSQMEFEDEVKLPPTWVFCSGNHDVEIGPGHAVA